jgi:hypothetical protein
MDHNQTQGGRILVHFIKVRGFFGPDAEPFEAGFNGNNWSRAHIKSAADAETLTKLRNGGMTYREIE